MKATTATFTLLALASTCEVESFSSTSTSPTTNGGQSKMELSAHTRRDFVSQAAATWMTATVAATTLTSSPQPALAAAAAMQDSLDIDNFLRTGVDAGGNMGVSSQAGKSRPQTGVVFRDGSDVSQDRATGAVAAELLTGTKTQPNLVLTTFNSPHYKLERGPVFDVECRDGKTGDGVFMAVSKSVDGKSLTSLPDAFFLERLFDPTGRFSFYGPPTDIKVKKRTTLSDSKIQLELSFSNLSQSTNAEIPRKALLVATLPQGTDNAVMLVGSATANRWNKQGSDALIRETIDSFQAVPAPRSNLKLRAKDRSGGANDFF
mmetsp:Transcript_6124/g.17224  ORF Transcript_6124/g.17224 Transcript_6124/m.17224 type:complete len:319 (+) Transcript_6124:42-998(+)